MSWPTFGVLLAVGCAHGRGYASIGFVCGGGGGQGGCEGAADPASKLL